MSSAFASPRSSNNWELQPSRKYASHGVVRTVPPAETIRRTLPLMEKIGVSRLGDVTNLDRVGIPNYMAVRPGGRDGISYYNGKGATPQDAKAGALMEAIERASAEECDLPVFYCTREEMERTGPTIDPAEIIVPHVTKYVPDLRIEWVEGFDLIAKRPTYVPLNAVICPYTPPEGRPVLHYASSNGLASGNTMEEALCHALCEVIERDAEAMAHTALKLKPAVASILAIMGLAAAETNTQPSGRFSRIDLDTLPSRCTGYVARLSEAGIKVYLRDATSTAGIPTFDCAIAEPQVDGSFLAHMGCGTHPDARVAASRAITEAAQSRLSCIQGGREDLPEFIKGPAHFDPEVMFGGGNSIPFSAVTSYVNDDIADDIRLMLQRLVEAGFTQVIALDMTRPQLGVPVVRVIVPRAEAWPVFQMHAHRGAFGSRIADLLHVTHPVAEELEPRNTI